MTHEFTRLDLDAAGMVFREVARYRNRKTFQLRVRVVRHQQRPWCRGRTPPRDRQLNDRWGSSQVLKSTPGELNLKSFAAAFHFQGLFAHYWIWA